MDKIVDSFKSQTFHIVRLKRLNYSFDIEKVFVNGGGTRKGLHHLHHLPPLCFPSYETPDLGNHSLRLESQDLVKTG